MERRIRLFCCGLGVSAFAGFLALMPLRFGMVGRLPNLSRLEGWAEALEQARRTPAAATALVVLLAVVTAGLALAGWGLFGRWDNRA